MTRKGAGIYEFHGESEFEIEGVWFFDFLLKKSGSKCVKQRKYLLPYFTEVHATSTRHLTSYYIAQLTTY